MQEPLPAPNPFALVTSKLLYCRDPRHGSVCAADRCDGCRRDCDSAFWSVDEPTAEELS